MHSFTTTLCAILTDLRAAIARIAARDRAPFLDFFWPRTTPTAQLFDLFEHLLAEWRNGTLPNASAHHQPPAATPSARRAARKTAPAPVPAPKLPPSAAPPPNVRRRLPRPATNALTPAPHHFEKPA